jgi:acyl transferase domain-containing protein/NADPH:quinone reductase-like Zn-dependent oxidoreductase/nucleoside-diphosphate-sugar epimerase/acyl carrier protein
VSSFGFSGTNAHVVLAAAPERAEAAAAERPLHVLPLSAAEPEALADLAERYEESLAQPGVSLADVALTAAAGRAQLARRLAVVAATPEEARDHLAAWRAGASAGKSVVAGEVLPGEPASVAFLFTGQGAQQAGMGRGLYETEPGFRAAIDRCDELLGGTLLPILYPPAGEASPIDSTQWSQPALFAVEVALAELLASWGIRPRAVLGHSIGEYAAACAAGVFSLEDGLRLVAERGRLMQALPAGGAMAAVIAAEDEVRAVLEPYGADLAVACLNGPANTVVSGREEPLRRLLEELASAGIEARPLTVSHAFHSPLVEPMLDSFEQAAAGVQAAAPRLRLVSSVTGEVAPAALLADPAYWRRQVREPVRFADAVRTAHGLGCELFVEIGPHPVLVAMGQACVPEGTGAWLPTLRRGADDWRTLLETVAALWCGGAALDWRRFHAGWPRRPVRLPTYPFRRRRYWVERTPGAPRRGRGAAGHPLLGRRVRSPLPELQFEAELATAALPFVADHRVGEASIMPATGWLELGLAAAAQAFGPGRHGLEDVVLAEPLALAEGEVRVLQTIVRSEGAGRARLEAQGLDEESGEWRLHATATLVRGAADGELPPAPVAPAVLAEALADTVAAGEHEAALQARGLAFGPSLRGVVEVRRRDGEALAHVRLPEAARSGAGGYGVHPALLDACLQPLAEALPPAADDAGLWLPIGIDRLLVHELPGDEAWSHVVLAGDPGAATLSGEVRVLDVEGRLLLELSGLRLRPASSRRLARVEGWLHELRWEPDPGGGAVADPAAIAPRLRERLVELATAHGLAAEGESRAALDAACGAAVAAALRELGWQPAEGERLTAAELAEKVGVVPAHRRLLGRLLEILAEDGVLAPDGEGWVVRGLPHGADPRPLLDEVAERDPDLQARVALVSRCAGALAEALAGRVDAVELLFPGGSTVDVEAVYRSSRDAHVYNALAAEAIAAALAELPSGRRPRLAEVGAGTGATAASVLPVLPEQTAEYLFTDVSPAFLARAAERFADVPFLSTALLDVERHPSAQGVTGGPYDVVLAVNVLHATADLAASLANVRALLAPGGLLVLLEATAPERWYDVTFGLTDGWWRFADGRRYALVGAGRWRELLEEAGFESVETVREESGSSRQALLLARAARPAEADGGRWLVLGDAGGIGERLAALLEADGASCLVARPGSGLEGPERLRRLVAEASSAGPLDGVVHLAALDACGDGPEAGAGRACRIALHLVQALVAGNASPRVWLVTRGAQAGGEPGEPVVPEQAPLWGLGRVLALEHPELAPVRVDLDPLASDAAAALLKELRRGDREDEVAHRDGTRRLARLVRLAGRARPGDDGAVRLALPGSGVLDELELVPAERRSPGPGEVELRVRATGLNFRDVLNALAVRSDPEPLGSECAGTVVSVGEGVSDLAPGDEVWGVAPGCFATYALAKADLLARRPPGLDPVAAATLPMAFLTAALALERLGRVGPGDRVLVHAAAGGVGLAAVELARRAGATVLATAGSPEKRAYLAGLGLDPVLDSRSPAFAEEILRLTGGRGVDVVLNSLTGELVDAGFAALAEGGRFLELGKRDVRSPAELAALRPGAEYVLVDLGAELVGHTQLVRDLFAELVRSVEAGEVRPLPARTVPIEAAVEAFRTMAQARHIGKVVVTQDVAAPLVRSDGSYLVTGGLAGLGLATAARLVERGARRVVLLGRSEPGAEARAVIGELEQAGARVTVLRGDVGRREDVERAVAAAEADGGRLRGVVHSAGILADGLLANQEWERFASVFEPKVAGAWNLHEATAGRELDWFCLFSSAAALLGSAGQANHAAANAFLDALAHRRRSLGLPAVSIDWGAWSEIGAAAARGVVERVAEQGVEPIPPREGLDAFELAIVSGLPQLAVLPVDWRRYLAARQPVPPRLSALAALEPRAEAPAAAADSALREELAAAPASRRRELLTAWVAGHAARVLALEVEAVHDRRPLQELGLDSLMAVELRNVLGAGLGLERPLPATLVFDFPTVAAISDYLERDVLGLDGDSGESEPAAGPEGAADLLEAIQRLSDEEVERLLSERGGEPVAE